uniref:CYTH domain-containing protein n=1 Tax=Mastacembelus armatus TaxID=205130 RepID=A0A3Q3N6G8_9TELE
MCVCIYIYIYIYILFNNTLKFVPQPLISVIFILLNLNQYTDSFHLPGYQYRAMLSNVEIKAKVTDPVQLAEKAAQLSQSQGTIIRQYDTFFNCSRGRLKLRDLQNGSGQLIFYERPDTDGPKLCRYSISPTSDPPSLRAVLSDALGVKGEVRKERRLFLIGQTRVHLDTVEGLGHYMELEVVMRPEQTVEEGQQVAEDLMEQLGVSKESLVTGAYMDLLLKGQADT